MRRLCTIRRILLSNIPVKSFPSLDHHTLHHLSLGTYLQWKPLGRLLPWVSESVSWSKGGMGCPFTSQPLHVNMARA